ncbi:restriction endonuclease subunit S [Mycobacterium sp. HM-7]
MGETELLANLLVDTKDGDWGLESSEADHTRHYVIRGADFPAVRLRKIGSVPSRFLPDKTVWRRTLQSNDILLETAGGTRDRPTGRSLLITPDVLQAFDEPVISASFTRFLRVDRTRIDPRYLYWYLQFLYSAGRMYEYQVQHTGIARFQYTVFANTERIPLPPMKLQEAIAELLGALDDKIAANERVVKASEALAEVYFARAISGMTFGEITFDDVASIGGGGTPKTTVEHYWHGDVQWATPTDVTALSGPYLRSTTRTITEDGLAACSSSLYPTGSILMTSRATIGAFAVAQVPMAVNQGFIVVNAKQPLLQWWLFHEMRSRVDEFISYANGATFLELSRGRFKNLPVRLPDTAQSEEFAELVGPLHRLAAETLEESRLLVRTRDELVPLLISGKLRVKDAETIAAEVL